MRASANLSDSAVMWRTLVSVMLSAILGSALATSVYTLWLSIWQGEALPTTIDDFRISLAICLVALWFTIPGATLLAAAEFVLANHIRSHRAIDSFVLAIGLFAGAGMLAALNLENAVGLALLGGFYGLTTATLFVVLQHQLRSQSRRSR